jgi:hypothetical protein
VLRLLDVDANIPIAQINANPTIAPRSRELDALSFALRSGRGPVSRAAKATFKALTPERAHRKVISAVHRNVVNGKAPPPDEALARELRRRFKGEVEALSDYLGRDLVTLWGYDDAG